MMLTGISMTSKPFAFNSWLREGTQKVPLAGGPREIKKLTYVFSSLDATEGE
jgi:hypothetical protein